jgi:membrane protease YdiL (CAAX protease family)
VPGGSAAFHAILTPAFLVRYLTNYIIYFIIGGPLGEEPGWRGLALPRLQWGYGPLIGTLILGVLWSLWHLPLMILIPGYNGSRTGFIGILIPFLEFLIEIVAMTIIITWIFNNVRGSLLLTMLLHGSLNTAGNTIPKLVPTLPQRSLVQPMEILLLVVSALLIIVLTRGYLSYQHYHQAAINSRWSTYLG